MIEQIRESAWTAQVALLMSLVEAFLLTLSFLTSLLALLLSDRVREHLPERLNARVRWHGRCTQRREPQRDALPPLAGMAKD